MKLLSTIALYVVFLFGFNTAYSACFNYNPETDKKQGTITFTYNGESKEIKSGIIVANQVLKLDKEKKVRFFTGICDGPDFTHTYETSQEISEWLFRAEFTLNVRGYDGGTETKTLAYVSSKHPNTIFINAQKAVGRNASDVANTLIHETIHNLDRKLEDVSFGHGGNSSQGKENSAPYWIGDLAQKIYENPGFKNDDPFIIEEDGDVDVSKVERWRKPRPKPPTRTRSRRRS